MKIGILRLPIGIGGAEMSLTEMGAVLRRAGHDVWIYFDKGNSHNSVKDFNKFGSLKNRCSDSAKSFFYSKDILSEEWAIEQLANTDLVFIIHRHLFSKNLAQATNKVKRKIVYAPGKNEHHIYGIYNGIQAYGHEITNIQNIVFNSNHTLNLHLKKSYPQNYKKLFKYVHPPMDLEFYSKFDQEKLRATGRKALTLNDPTFAIGVFGRLIPSKQPENVIKMATSLKNRIENFKIFFIGDGPEKNNISNLIKKHNLNNHVTILGMQDLPFESLCSMDVILHLCEHESMSRALRESMFFGKPIVAFKGAGNLELCNGDLEKLLFQNHGQAQTKLVYLDSNKKARLNYGQLSRNRINVLEKNAKQALLELVG